MKTKTSKILRNLAILSGLTFLGILTVTKAVGAQDYSHLIMRGSHGAFQLPEPSHDTNLHSVKTYPVGRTEPSQSVPILITRGPNGGGFFVTKAGVGGPEGNEVYPGYPKLIQRGPHGAFSPK
jgi:hypothetical protein